MSRRSSCTLFTLHPQTGGLCASSVSAVSPHLQMWGSLPFIHPCMIWNNNQKLSSLSVLSQHLQFLKKCYTVKIKRSDNKSISFAGPAQGRHLPFFALASGCCDGPDSAHFIPFRISPL